MHAFCALDATMKEECDPWQYQFVIEKDIMVKGKFVPLTEPDKYNSQMKILL